MNQYNSLNVKLSNYQNPNLNDQQQFRLNKINEIKDYFIAKIREEELINNKTY